MLKYMIGWSLGVINLVTTLWLDRKRHGKNKEEQ
jgi:hypothetical protein